MKKFIMICSILFSTFVWAEKNWGVGVSYLYTQMAYKEPALMSEKGNLMGLGIDARWDPLEHVSLHFQSRFLGGNLEYDGSTFDGDPLTQTTKDKVNEYRALVFFKLEDLAPYIGYGYRYWFNDLVISYRRETTYYYLPIGLRYVWRPFYVNYEYRHFLSGLNESHMGDVGGGRRDVSMKQKSGKAYALEAGYLVRVSEFDVKFSVAYEFWGIEDSETSFDGVDTLIEPHNSTNTLVFSLGLYY